MKMNLFNLLTLALAQNRFTKNFFGVHAMKRLIALFMTVVLGQGATVLADDKQDLLQVFMGELVSIHPGKGEFASEFTMGSDEAPNTLPVRKVPLAHSFHIAKYEVPQNLYEEVMGENPSRWKGVRNSVEMVTLDDAQKFCEKLTSKLHDRQLLPHDEEIRLPTEIEWEYCCRAGTTTRYSFGDVAQAAGDTGKQATILNKYAWHTGNAAGNDPPVGALAPNPWGLYDMHGYLSEMCSDTWQSADKTAASADPIVVRGGSWKDAAPKLTSAWREPFPKTGKDDAVGFRCVRAARAKSP